MTTYGFQHIYLEFSHAASVYRWVGEGMLQPYYIKAFD